MARLDRLATVREIAQIGATIGREFNYELLKAVSPLHEEALQQGLRQLVDAELVFQSGVPPPARYLFKHALVQDTAYQSLLKSRRQRGICSNMHWYRIRPINRCSRAAASSCTSK
jgi:predicted ATPase